MIRFDKAPEVLYIVPALAYESLYNKRRVWIGWLQWAVIVEWRRG